MYNFLLPVEAALSITIAVLADLLCARGMPSTLYLAASPRITFLK